MTVLPGLTLAQNTMKVRYEFTSALAGFLLLFIFIAATPVFAQTDGGLGVTDAMRVADTGLTIEFSMPLAAGVSFRVYNVLGQVVKTLVNGTLPPGIHRVSWDATDQSGASVSSGLYIYRMETESFQATKTLVLMK